MKLPSLNLSSSDDEEVPSILKVPGHLFFCEYVEVPAELEPEELDEFAEMGISSLSPFPLEQLAWGYHKDPQSPWLLLYSATLESLARAGFRGLDTYRQVFPSFISVLGFHFEKPTGYFLYDSGSLSLVLHPGSVSDRMASADAEDAEEEDNEREALPPIELPLIHSLPVQLTTDPTEDDLEDESDDENAEDIGPSRECIESVRAQMFRMIPERGYTIEPAWLREIGHEFSTKDGSLTFHHQWDEQGRPQSGPDQQLGAQEHLWQADIRPSAYKEHEKKNRKVERFLARAGKVAGIAAAVLLVLEILVMLSGGWVGSMQAQSNGNESQVQKILSKGDLLSKLTKRSTNNLQPFHMLQVLNDYRIGRIFFRKIEAADGSSITVAGEAANAGEINSYKDSLLQSPDVQSCVTELRTRKGETTFTLTAVFKITVPEGPVLEPEPAPSPSPASVSPSTQGSSSGPPTAIPSSAPPSPPPGPPPSLPPPQRPRLPVPTPSSPAN